jgi:hypothetical protein
MTGLDWIVAPLALVAFALSIGTVIWFVPAPGLVVVSVFAIALGAYDFYLTASGKAQRVDKRRR